MTQHHRLLAFGLFLVWCTAAFAQSPKTGQKATWVKVDEDEPATIYYRSDIVTNKQGNHIVWVRADFHTPEWQEYMATLIGSKQRIAMTHTKAEYDEIYSLVRVRQVLCYNKAGKLIYDTGDGTSAGWGYVNASDPVGIVGEYLGK